MQGISDRKRNQPPQERESTEDEAETVLDVRVGGRTVTIDKRDSDAIINSDCKRIMRNLCTAQAGRVNLHADASGITQPSFLSPEERAIFFRTKMFYLLQERHVFMHQQPTRPGGHQQAADGAAPRKVADAYASFLSPFCNPADLDADTPTGGAGVRRRRPLNSDFPRIGPDGARVVASALGAMQKTRAAKLVQNPQQKTGMAKFMENIRKADQSVLHTLDKKILKTIEGAGYAALFGVKEMRKPDVILSLFPDYNLLQLDGKDEEIRLNNLVSHVRTRIKMFDKLQSYYENPNHDDHTAHVFTMPNVEAADVREELANLKPKRLHQLDEKKILKLYAILKDDYSTAKTTLIADGTQPIVQSRKKLDRVKKYVDDCADWRGKMLVPYVRETNFFFLMFPWTRPHDSRRMESSADSVSTRQSE